MLALGDWKVEKKGRKLSGETYCQRRSCKIEPISHKHAIAAEHADTHTFSHSVRLTSIQKATEAQTCQSLPAGGGMASD